MSIVKELKIQIKVNINANYKKRKIKKSHLLLYNLFLLLLKFIVVDLIFAKNIRNINNFYSEIFLIIVGNGNQSLLFSEFYLEPSEVIVNGISKTNLYKNTFF